MKKNQIKRFVYNTLVEEENLCNLKKESKQILAALKMSDKLVIYGKRDSGKTSLVKNVIIPSWQKQHSKNFIYYVELYGVTSIAEIAEKLTIYFNKAYSDAFKVKSSLSVAANLLKGIRPVVTLSQDGSFEATFKTDAGAKILEIGLIFDNIKKLSNSGIKVVLFIDEFQDIALVPGAEATLREELQKLPFEIPVIVLGSKQHLLSKIFQKPKAPFFNWGKRLEIPDLPMGEYSDYILERFEPHQIKVTDDVLLKLQETLLRNPEAINMFCSHLVYVLGMRGDYHKELNESVLNTELMKYVESLSGEFETYLANYTRNEIKVLTYIAKKGVLTAPTSKETLAQVGVSTAGMRNIIEKFLDHADIYREEQGFILSKPLLMHYLRNWRI